MSTGIVWFRRDLRLRDNPALLNALERHERVLLVYIHAPDEEAPWMPGGASRWWLHHSLAALHADVQKRGSALHIEHGASLAVLQRLLRETDADSVYWNRLYEPASIVRDKHVKQALVEQGTEAHSFNATLLIEPWDIQTGQGQPYKVFTPYWRNARARLEPRVSAPAPKRIESPAVKGAMKLASLGLIPKIRWDAGLAESWQPGEQGAWDSIAEFFAHAVRDYQQARDVPGMEGTSRLSPHLHFGEISPQQILWHIEELARSRKQNAEGLRQAAEPFLRELGWRDFSFHLLYHFPRSADENLNPQFDRFPWAQDDAVALERWQRGRTGIPIVDAGMRQLWHTGWMHNRVRMVVASFLTKNLRQHWLHGAHWFWDTLVDADLPNNTQGWQWTAGCGADAAPYFRIFNPVSQGQRFDPEGSYVRRWVPELAKVDKKVIHSPWTKPGLLEACGYPEPMVDLKESREAALAGYQKMRG
jgi:deoxyribodipyrimidine photo-lyase